MLLRFKNTNNTKMKLFGFFAVFVSADERAFSNVPDFMSGNSDWWNSNNAVAQFDDLKVGADKFFADYWTTKAGARVGEKAAALLEDVRSDMLKISKSGKCTSAYRKRSNLGPYVWKNFKNLVRLVATSKNLTIQSRGALKTGYLIPQKISRSSQYKITKISGG